MRDLHWSHSEKAVARAAFDAALSRETEAIRREAEALLRRSAEAAEIWNVLEFLSEKRREVERKYDYRYSVLVLVLGRLLAEGWIRETDLVGLSAEKLELIQRSAAQRR